MEKNIDKNVRKMKMKTKKRFGLIDIKIKIRMARKMTTKILIRGGRELDFFSLSISLELELDSN